MSLVADYGSDDENTSSSSESEQVSKPTVTVDTPSICGIRRPGLAAFLPPPKRTRTEPASDKASTVTEGGKRKVQIVVPLPEPATSSDEEDETKRQPTTTTHSKTSQASSGLCAFLPPPKNRKPVGQSGSSTAASRSSFGNVASHTGSTQRVLGGGVAHARDILGIATGDDAEPLDTSDVSEKPSTASSASTNSDVGSGHSVNSMIPYSLLKRKKTTNTNQNNTSKETESFDADLGLLPTEVEDTSYEAYTTSKPSSSSISAAPGAASEQETDKSDTRHDQTMYQYNTTYTATDMYGYYQTNGIGDTTTLSDEAIAALTGRRKKRHDFGPINIIDVHQSEQVKYVPSRQENISMPLSAGYRGTSAQRRTNNIMFLARQAAAYQEELDARAAAARRTRRETASKYGFI